MLIKIGTRGSKLALWQAHHFADLLQKSGVQTEIIVVETKGDKILDVALSKIGSKGVFTEELESKLLSGNIDIAVHSAKDLPSQLPDNLHIIAFGEREKVNDVLVSFDDKLRLDNSVHSFIIGTSSTRRVALLKHYFPNNSVVDIRGNLQTRIRKLEEGQCNALLLAYAGVHRMGYDKYIVQQLSIDIFTPQAGQGAIAIEASTNLSSEKYQIVRQTINHTPTQICIESERTFLKTMNGGCSIPAYVLATFVSDNQIEIKGGIISLDGKININKNIKTSVESSQNEAINLANWVLENGGSEILKEIKSNSNN
ncbi:MAG: hydroxymethylbilane synthase [Bacteroidota bacterium]|nr:hydroxymethylbilane synthase [Bacteroidota bacterium]